MEEISRILSEFIVELKTEILEFFILADTYLKDLIAYKNIDLKKNIVKEDGEVKKSTIERILKAIKTGLNTIGIPIEKLNESQKNFLKLLGSISNQIPDYNSYIEIYLRNFIHKILFETFFDYMLDIEAKKIENLNLFDLLPPNFLEKIDNFKEKNLKSNHYKKIFLNQNFDDYINFSDLTIKIKKQKSIQEEEIMTEKKPAEALSKSEKSEEPEKDILTQLREAKESIIETLKKPRKESLTPSIVKLEEESVLKEKISQPAPTVQKITPKIESIETKVARFPPEDLPIKQEKLNFLETFGNLTPIHTDIIKKFKVDKVNLINSRVNNLGFMDLENLFYYISNLKMLNFNFPFTTVEILEIVKNFLNENIFSSSKENIPDIKNIFYGLSIFSELKLLKSSDLINYNKIEDFIKSNLKVFIPERLESNLFSLLCLRLMNNNQLASTTFELFLNKTLQVNLQNLEEYNPIQDIYNHLGVIKLFNKKFDIKELKRKYLNEIKKLIISNGSINNIITESAKTFLILDLLNLKEQEPDICSGLLKFILNSTTFFNLINLNIDFNWQNNQIGYKIELKMLFWALLACSRYTPQKS